MPNTLTLQEAVERIAKLEGERSQAEATLRTAYVRIAEMERKLDTLLSRAKQARALLNDAIDDDVTRAARVAIAYHFRCDCERVCPSFPGGILPKEPGC